MARHALYPAPATMPCWQPSPCVASRPAATAGEIKATTGACFVETGRLELPGARVVGLVSLVVWVGWSG